MSILIPRETLTLWCATAAALALLTGGCSGRLTDEERVEQARAELARGDAPAAAIQLRTVLRQDPSNVEARVLLAQAGLQSGDVETAAKEYRRALDLGAELNDIRTPYAEALVRARAADEALRVTDPDETENAPELVYWRGQALLQEGRVEEAQAAFESMAAEPGWHARAKLGMARVALQRHQVAEAKALLESVAGDLQHDVDYLETMGSVQLREGQPDAAAQTFAKAAEAVVDATGNRQFMMRAAEAEALLAAGKLPEARTKAEQLLGMARQHPVPNYVMARVELQAGNHSQALAHAQAVLAANPSSAPGHLVAGASFLALGQVTAAERHLEHAVAIDSENVGARRLLAQTRLGLESPGGALEALGPLVEGSTDPQSAAIAGIASVRAGDPEAAVEIYRRQLELDPDNDEMRSLLGISLIAAGRLEEALAEFSRVSPSNPIVRQRADLFAIAAHLEGGEVAQARQAAADLAEAHPANAELRSSLGGMFLAANELEDASAWFEEALRVNPEDMGARFNFGRIAAALGDVDEARGHFEAVIAAQPENGAALAALGQIAWAERDRERAVGYLQRARQADENNVRARLLLAGYLVELGRVAEAETVAREAVVLEPENAMAANSLGLALLRSGRAREALTQFHHAQRLEPGAAGILINQARAHLALENPEGARQVLINALALDPNNDIALFALVEVERRAGRLEAAAQAFTRLERAAPVSARPIIERVRGELLLAQGDFSAASEAFREAIDLGAGSKAVLGRFQAVRQGNLGAPAALLQDWLAQHPDDTIVRRRLADYYLQVEDFEAAIGEYERLLSDASDDPALLNNLAWLYSRQGDARSLRLAEQAHQLAPQNPQIADTLAWILHKQGDNARALELLQRATQAAPQNGEIQYHHAVVLAETGDTTGARRAARAVLAESGAVNFHEAAQKLLDSLDSGGSGGRE